MQEMIHIMVRPFGPVTSIMGTEPIEYGLVPPVTLDGLIELLYAKYPKLADGAASLRFAVNEEYADADTELAEGDEGASIPPVADG